MKPVCRETSETRGRWRREAFESCLSMLTSEIKLRSGKIVFEDREKGGRTVREARR